MGKILQALLTYETLQRKCSALPSDNIINSWIFNGSDGKVIGGYFNKPSMIWAQYL